MSSFAAHDTGMVDEEKGNLIRTFLLLTTLLLGVHVHKTYAFHEHTNILILLILQRAVKLILLYVKEPLSALQIYGLSLTMAKVREHLLGVRRSLLRPARRGVRHRENNSTADYPPPPPCLSRRRCRPWRSCTTRLQGPLLGPRGVIRKTVPPHKFTRRVRSSDIAEVLSRKLAAVVDVIASLPGLLLSGHIWPEKQQVVY